jgi:DNA-binding NtrC family response regulator
MGSVIVIEKQRELHALLERHLGRHNNIEASPSVRIASDRIQASQFDAIVWDTNTETIAFPRIGRYLLKLAKKSPQSFIVVVSDAEEPYLPPESRLAYSWMQRPFDAEELTGLVEAALERNTGPDQKKADGFGTPLPVEFEGILAVSLPMRFVIQQILDAAAEDIPVLISGETGTGKDLVAAAIHKRSKRKDEPYLAVNMGAIAPELVASELFGHERGAYTGASEARAGFFEQAQGGTLFLDEITTMDEKTQVSLLRVLETKSVRRVRGERDIKVNVRVIAATNENIEEAVKSRRFREDLFYRLDVFRIDLPPLRERPRAATLLADHFVSIYDAMYKKNVRVISDATYRLLRNYKWPGNVRELKNVIQRAVLMAKAAELTPDLLPARIRDAAESGAARRVETWPIQIGMTLADVEKEFISMTIASVGGNKKKAAAVLGVSRRALYNKLKRFGLL